MKALILVGGFGTRLRPLTLSVPKPLVDFANKPMILHQIEALKRAGVNHVILAIAYQPSVMMNFLKEYEQKLDIKITCSEEETPMGTAGPLAIARKLLDDGSGEPFFMLNADVICEYPLREALEYHKKHKGEATILVTKVMEPSKYGVVVFDEESGMVDRFVEKPKQFVGNKINAGIYVLSPSILDRVEMRPTSIEKEIFPLVSQENKLFAKVLEGYWMDVGQPKDYLTGLNLYLSGLKQKSSPLLSSGAHVQGNAVIDPSATIGEGCVIGPNACVGKDCVIEDGVCLRNCMVFPGTRIGKHSCITGSIIGWRSHVGQWARLENMCVFGEDVQCKDELYLNGAVVLPHKEVKGNVVKPEIII
jgi:mannose-1-phosphate guanylyltransferase